MITKMVQNVYVNALVKFKSVWKVFLINPFKKIIFILIKICFKIFEIQL